MNLEEFDGISRSLLSWTEITPKRKNKSAGLDRLSYISDKFILGGLKGGDFVTLQQSYVRKTTQR